MRRTAVCDEKVSDAIQESTSLMATSAIGCWRSHLHCCELRSGAPRHVPCHWPLWLNTELQLL